MATYRLIHREASTGERSSSLSHLGFRVWVQYQLSADDYGICPAEAVKLQGDNSALLDESPRRIQAEIEKLIAARLVGSFMDGKRRYLYQPDWQDWQRIEHPTQTALPCIPRELFGELSPKTQKLFAEKHPKRSQVFALHAGARDATATANAVLEGGVGETKLGPKPHAPGLIRSPLEFEQAQRRCAFVGARLEVPKKFHGELVRDTGGADADTRLQAWYQAVDAEIERTGEPIRPDVFTWLRARWKTWVGAPKPASAVPDEHETRRELAAIRARAGQ